MNTHNRLRGTLPKIGIRPTIDGRYGGVRESLEEPTMKMAQIVKVLIESEFRHACGLPVEVVIAQTCIGNASEAAQCADLFARENVGVSLTVTPCWCYGSETIDMTPQIPKAIWGFNGTERPGAVYLAAALAGHTQKGLPAFGIYGRDVQDGGDENIPDDVREKILRFARAGIAVASMKGSSYLAIGGVSMGIAGSIVDHDFFEDYLGMRVESVDMTEVTRRIAHGIFDDIEYSKALEWTKINCIEGDDLNPEGHSRTREQLDEDWETSVKMALIIRDLMNGNPRLAEMGFKEEAQGHNAIVSGFQGQRAWTDYAPNGDFPEAILNTSFDWNGVRQPYLVATENDSLNGASMLLGHLLTGSAQLFADVRTYWSADSVERVTGHKLEGRAANGILHLINSGPAALDWTGEQSETATKGGMRFNYPDGEYKTAISASFVEQPVVKSWWKVSDDDAKKCLAATRWCPSMTEYFSGGGWSTDFTTRGEMPVTMFRLNLTKGLGPTLQIAEGYAIDLPLSAHRVLDSRTNPTWPTTWFAPNLIGDGAFVDVYSVMNNWGANHGTIAFGHIGADLISLAAMLRIPVDMHNVSDDKLFRPSSWSRFGTHESQSADYRACETYGALYK